MWIYSQSTGILKDADGHLVGRGYAGNGAGLNEPAFQNVKDVGPLPRGMYTFGPLRIDDPVVGEYAIPLIPDARNEMFDRSDFFCHGDNPSLNHSASDGCMVQTKSVRIAMYSSADRRVMVTA
jgi:hypothetical protein